MGSTWDKIDKLHLFYRKGPIFFYPSKQSAALPCESIGLYITEMTLLKAEEKNGFSYMNRIYLLLFQYLYCSIKWIVLSKVTSQCAFWATL